MRNKTEGTLQGTTTDEKGAYSIMANNGETLEFSAVGFGSASAKVGSNLNINMILTEATKDLEGVVATALGIKKEEKALGYSNSAAPSPPGGGEGE